MYTHARALRRTAKAPWILQRIAKHYPVSADFQSGLRARRRAEPAKAAAVFQVKHSAAAGLELS
jgi:hypothetical protein